MWTLKKNGYRKGRREHVVYAESTLKRISKRLAMLSRSVNLDDPEAVRDYIVDHGTWKNSFKEAMADCYDHYARVNGLVWSKPIFQRKERLPNIPSKEQIALIHGESIQKYALSFSLIEEWGLRPVELYETRVRDMELDRGINNIETAKWGLPRKTEPLKPKTLAMLKTYLSLHNFGFNDQPFPTASRMRHQWDRAKKRVAKKLCDPTILKFRLYDLRHYYGTMTYHKTKDLLYVKEKMGHRSIKNTMIYVHLIEWRDEEYVAKVAETKEQRTTLIEQGFEFVLQDGNGLSYFRKRK